VAQFTGQRGIRSGRHHRVTPGGIISERLGDFIGIRMWDGQPRIRRFLSTYCGAKNTLYARGVAFVFFVGLIRRARHPGCKHDTCMVLEGPEGLNKSTAFEVLAGGPTYFSDEQFLGLEKREQQEAVQGKWVFEFSDLNGIRKTDVESVKSTMSRTHDRARGAYARFQKDQPRTCVFVGSTNEGEYLKSRTGNRRFHPVKVCVTRDSIDVNAVRRDRDQLLAEAAWYEARDASNVLPEKLWSVAKVEQDKRIETDPWEDTLATVHGVKKSDGKYYVSYDMLADALGIPKPGQHDGIMRRITGVMASLGWTKETNRFRYRGGTLARGFSIPAERIETLDRWPIDDAGAVFQVASAAKALSDAAAFKANPRDPRLEAEMFLKLATPGVAHMRKAVLMVTKPWEVRHD
jgi:predicted P-loop ATPase